MLRSRGRMTFRLTRDFRRGARGLKALDAYFQRFRLDTVALRWSAAKGRHLVARTELAPGELIFIEDALLPCSDVNERCTACGELECVPATPDTLDPHARYVPYAHALSCVDDIAENTGQPQEVPFKLTRMHVACSAACILHVLHVLHVLHA